ncbi:NAD(P)H-dependent oxidoreductase [Rhizobium sp. RU36D]|uniref:NAD(P)H-dependent oxidoreductase n=1 Tax=Rhizobium sp. RU36D TaxID=1907415 RepID=UPI0009D88E56|nr:NAD(P)H-dependent oxidoreductase [Rhizobium sp. RU36D]SMD14532.1 Putative NADPH-quinone reductase (modulator of drug activity B) [Rhizobium sp. RU36D]
MSNILIIQGHPDGSVRHFCHALADAYAEGATEGGHEVSRLDLSQIEFPLLQSQAEQEGGAVPPAIAEAQTLIAAAQHVVVVFPLWLGDMPALVKGFFEQALRPGFAYSQKGNPMSPGLLKGRSMRIVITMGMPGWYYRLVYGAHSLKAMRIGMFGYVGFRPVRASIVGNVAGKDAAPHDAWLAEMRKLGRLAR